MELRTTVPSTVQVAVHNAHVTLTGQVRRLFHKMEAEKAVRRVKGVLGIFNHIEVTNEIVAHDVRQRIVEGLERSAAIDPRQVFVTVDGTVAMLSGTVTTWVQRDVAERAAANAPGITYVENYIVVAPPVEPVDELC
jgi:osmotically-inducible protein OsmY